MTPLPLFIDTDCGEDIDDAYAIAFAALRPEINLLGVGTVMVDSARRAAAVRELLDACGRTDVPVAAGIDWPLGDLSAEQRARLADESKMNHCPPAAPEQSVFRENGGAVGLLARTLEAHPEGVVVVGIGPCTNLGALLEVRPDLAPRVRAWALMGGEVALWRAEHNIVTDVLSAARVFDSDRPVFLATWSVSRRLRYTSPDCAELRDAGARGNPVARLLAEWTARWLPLQNPSFKDCPVLYDIAPVLWAFRPDLFTTERRALAVETTGTFTRGWTVPCCGRPARIDVTLDMDVDSAHALLKDTLLP